MARPPSHVCPPPPPFAQSKRGFADEAHAPRPSLDMTLARHVPWVREGSYGPLTSPIWERGRARRPPVMSGTLSAYTSGCLCHGKLGWSIHGRWAHTQFIPFPPFFSPYMIHPCATGPSTPLVLPRGRHRPRRWPQHDKGAELVLVRAREAGRSET